MQCPSCGYENVSGAERCASCGRPLPQTIGQGYGLMSSSEPPSTPPGGPYQQPPSGPYQQPPSGPYQQPPTPQPQYPAPGASYGETPGQPGVPPQPAPPGYGTPPPPGYGVQAPPSGYGMPPQQPGYGAPAPQSGYGPPQQPGAPYPGYGQAAPPSYPMQPGQPGWQQYAPGGPPQPPKRSRTGLIVGVIITIVVIIVACSAGGLYLASQAGNLTTTDIGVATATAGPSPTPSPTVLYQNTLTSSQSDWLDDGSNCFFKSDGYHITNGYVCFAPIGDQGNVNISVQVKQTTGKTTDPYGIAFRYADNDDNYAFDIDSNGKWVFFKCTKTTCDALVDYTANSAIHGGLNTQNTLEVHATGSHYDLFVNSTKVGQVDDASYTTGRVGLHSSTDTENVFTNLTVSKPAGA